MQTLTKLLATTCLISALAMPSLGWTLSAADFIVTNPATPAPNAYQWVVNGQTYTAPAIAGTVDLNKTLKVHSNFVVFELSNQGSKQLISLTDCWTALGWRMTKPALATARTANNHDHVVFDLASAGFTNRIKTLSGADVVKLKAYLKGPNSSNATQFDQIFKLKVNGKLISAAAWAQEQANETTDDTVSIECSLNNDFLYG